MIVFIFAMILVSLFVFKANDEINTAIQASPALSNESKQVTANVNSSFPGVMDSMVAFAFMGLWLLALFMAYNSGGSPVLVIFSIIIIAFMAVAAMILSNIWSDVSSEASLSSYASSFPITNFLLNNYLVVFIVVGFSVVMVLASRGGGGL